MARQFISGNLSYLDAGFQILNGRSTFTIAAKWQRTVSGSYGLFIGEGAIAGNACVIQPWNDNNVYATFGTSIWGNYTLSSTDVDPHGLVVRYDGGATGNSNRLRVWQDGVEQSLSYTGTIPSSATTGGNFRLGQDQRNNAYSDSKGSEVAIWGTALEVDACAALSTLPITPLFFETNLMDYWPLHGRGGAAANEVDFLSSGVLIPSAVAPTVVDHPRVQYPGRKRGYLTRAAAVTAISATTGVETWNGLSASINARTAIAATRGTETWNGLSASVRANTNILATRGTETWNGLTANIIVPTVILATRGSETWSGLTASINARTQVNATLGVETWSGLAASINARTQVNASLGVETWNGIAASVVIVSGALNIQATRGTEIWGSPGAASITGGGISTTQHPFRIFRAGKAKRGPIYRG